MKKFLIVFSFLVSSCVLYSQITDTASLRVKINQWIVPNSAITATKLNTILSAMAGFYTPGAGSPTLQAYVLKYRGNQLGFPDTLNGVTAPKIQFFPTRSGAFRAGVAPSDEWDISNIGYGSSAFGIGTKASALAAFAAGSASRATGLASTALGNNVSASGEDAVAMGFNSEARSKYSVAIGATVTAKAFAGISFGTANDTSDAPFSYPSSSDRVFQIGIGTDIVGFGTRENGFTMLRNGNIGIGNQNNPTTKFHVNGGVRIQDGTEGAGKVFTDVSGNGTGSWQTPAASGISSLSISTINGFSGTATGGATPVITLTTPLTGIIKAGSSAFSVATPGTDYVIPSSLTDVSRTTQANVYGAFKQTFTGALAGFAGINIAPLAGNPGTVVPGDIWYNSSTGSGVLRYNTAAGNRTLINLDEAQVLTNKDLSSGTNTFPTLNQNTTGNAATVTTIPALSNEVSNTGNSVTLLNSAVINKLLTGFTSGAGALSSADNILQAIQKLNGNDGLKANLASPTLTGTPLAPTATAGTNTTQIATTGFVAAAMATLAKDTLFLGSGESILEVAQGNGSTTKDSLRHSLFGANQFVAGPVSGSATQPTKRALDPLDIPNLSATKITSGTLAVANGGDGGVSFTIVMTTIGLATPVTNTTYYFGAAPNSGMTTASNQKAMYMPFNCKLVGYALAGRSSIASVPANAITLSIVNITTSTTTQLNNTFLFTGATANTTGAVGLNITFTAGDTYQLKLDVPTWTTVATNIEPYVILYFKNL